MKYFIHKRFLLVSCLLTAGVAMTCCRPTTLYAAEEEPAVRLTPQPSETPQINGPRVFGVRPSHPFLFTIPVTGRRPMAFAAEGLPAGLALDPDTGRITGAIGNRGEFVVVLRVKNALGQDERKLKIVCGDTLALTPPMGWNSWYIWTDRVTDQIMRDAADAMVASDMINFGYSYVNVDDCWTVKKDSKKPAADKSPRDAQGNLNSNHNFPDMKALADYIHAKGLKAGLYISPGPLTCCGNEGSYKNEAQDARRFAEWGFDFLKYDWCSYGHIANGGDPEAKDIKPYGQEGPSLEIIQRPFRLMGELIQKQNRDIVLNFCQYGMGDVWKWGRDCGGHCWRTAGDLGSNYNDPYASISKDVFDLFGRNELQKYSAPGAWNDPDYLLLGYRWNWKQDKVEKTRLTPNEQYTHVSLWCLLAAPLIFSGDIARLDDFTLGLLCNREVIDVDQDPLGRAALRVGKQGEQEVWAKEMEDGSKAVGLFNRSEKEAAVTAKWAELGLNGPQRVRDLWRQKDLGTFDGEFSAPVGRHGVVLVRMYPAATPEKPKPEDAPAAIDDEAGFKPIFNGKTLDGWIGSAEHWTVEDGALTGTTTAEKPLKRAMYLFWKDGRPANFVLRTEYRFVTPKGNSGINFRSRELPGGDIHGYQADMEAGPNYTGILYECNQRAIITKRGQKVTIAPDGKREEQTLADAAELQKHIKPNDWNQYEIIARGPEIILKINGQVMSHVIDREEGKAAAEGLIALQIHPGPPMKVQFRNIRLKTE